MTEKERIERFKSHNLVVNCRTEDEAKKLVKWCYENGFKWRVSSREDTNFNNINNCYSINGKYLEFADKEFYEDEQFEIMTYQEFFQRR